MPNFKPAGYTSVAPYLIVEHAAATITFLEKVFGARVLRRFDDDKGHVHHAEVRIDDTVVMLADATREWLAAHAHVHVYVNDVDSVYQHALDAGASSVKEPVQGADEDKRGGVKDPGGTTWWIATKVQ